MSLFSQVSETVHSVANHIMKKQPSAKIELSSNDSPARRSIAIRRSTIKAVQKELSELRDNQSSSEKPMLAQHDGCIIPANVTEI